MRLTTRPPTGLGSRRAVPRQLDDTQRARLRHLLTDPDNWVLRSDWERYLLHGDRATLIDTAELSSEHRVAVLAWLDQQRHLLHQILEGGMVAPDGWIEAFPLYERLATVRNRVGRQRSPRGEGTA